VTAEVRRRPRLPALGGSILALALFGCWTLTASLEDLSNDAADRGATEAGLPPDGAGSEATPPPADARSVDGATCLAIKRARPESPDGMYRVDPDEGGPSAPFDAFCDMTGDGGGWMLVTPALAPVDEAFETTVVRETDARGGLVLRVYANNRGCAETVQHARHLVLLASQQRWTRVRAHQSFFGAAECWTIFGGKDPTYPLAHNLVPFDSAVDVARDARRMGGSTVDGFPGIVRRCDSEPNNFWAFVSGFAERSLTVILRRASPDAPAGLATNASCAEVDAGTGSPTSWVYRDVFVQ
jgi:hypothetical protein